ncbi:MAG: hypothetical protein SFT92_08560 [Rickettsiales bacterium]|nr:hypothetical protein [Rickettsiales bacterium]
MAFSLAPDPAVADDEEGIEDLLAQFTRSMVVVFVASEMCKDTLKTNLPNYADTIRTYLTQYYPKGIGYWVLPMVTEREKNKKKCNSMLQERLMYYQTTSREFTYSYPAEPLPPVLVAMRNNDYQNPSHMYGVRGRLLPTVVAPSQY